MLSPASRNRFQSENEIIHVLHNLAVDMPESNDKAALTRALKKYEADTDKATGRTLQGNSEIFSPFGPLISRSWLPEEPLASIAAYIERLELPEHSCEFQIPQSVVEAGSTSLADCVSTRIADYLATADRSEGQVSSIQFERFWAVYQREGSPSPMHFHSGDISGVLYLRVPSIASAELSKSYISGRQAGHLNFIIGGKQPYSRSLASFSPEVGQLYIFPAWLLHGAEPFSGAGDRLSIAFNAFVDKPVA